MNPYRSIGEVSKAVEKLEGRVQAVFDEIAVLRHAAPITPFEAADVSNIAKAFSEIVKTAADELKGLAESGIVYKAVFGASEGTFTITLHKVEAESEEAEEPTEGPTESEGT